MIAEAKEIMRISVLYEGNGSSYRFGAKEESDNTNTTDFLSSQTHQWKREQVKGLCCFRLNNWMEDPRKWAVESRRSAIDITVSGKLQHWYQHSFTLAWGDNEFTARYTDVEKIYATYLDNESCWDDDKIFNHNHMQLECFRIELTPVTIRANGKVIMNLND
jgi:hypothetical protein